MPKMSNKDFQEEMDKYESDENEENFNREDIWHFYYFVAATILPLLKDFLDVAEFKPTTRRNIHQFDTPPPKCISTSDFRKMIASINLLVRYFNEGGLKYKGKKINFEWGDTIVELLEALHLFVDILPYLNDRHYRIPREKYNDTQYGCSCEYEELLNLDKTIAKLIFPTLESFSYMTAFLPKWFSRIYTFALPHTVRTDKYNCSEEWHKALEAMVESWRWVLTRKPTVTADGWEEVPEKIYYGLHLFAEYLPEMQND